MNNKVISLLLLIIGMIITITLSAQTNQAPLIPAKLQYDYLEWMANTKVSDEKEFAGGKLYRIAEGARFIDASGMVTMMPKENPNFNKIALENPNIAKEWADKYGFIPQKLKANETKKNESFNLSSDQNQNSLLFQSYLNQASEIKKREAKLRASLEKSANGKNEIDCNREAMTPLGDPKIKLDCQELLHLARAYGKTLKSLEKLKKIVNGTTANQVAIDPAVTNSATAFSATIKAPESTVKKPVSNLGNWDKTNLVEGVMEYVVCLCGEAQTVAQVLGNKCPEGSVINASIVSGGPYLLNNVSTVCDPTSAYADRGLPDLKPVIVKIPGIPAKTYTLPEMNINNIDLIISGMSNFLDLTNLWEVLLRGRTGPPDDRFFELRTMLQDHVIPVFQARVQKIDVIPMRASNFKKYPEPRTGSDPLTPEITKMVEEALRLQGLQSNTVHTDGEFMAIPIN